MADGPDSPPDVAELIFDSAFRDKICDVSDRLDPRYVAKLQELRGPWARPAETEARELWRRLGEEAVRRGLVEPPSPRPVPAMPKPQYEPQEGEECEDVGPDGFEIYPNDPYAEGQRLISRMMVESEGRTSIPKKGPKRTKLLPSMDEVDSAKGDRRARLMVAAARRWAWLDWREETLRCNLRFATAETLSEHSWPTYYVLTETVNRGTAPTPEQLVDVLAHRSYPSNAREICYGWEDDKLLKIVARTIRDHCLSEPLSRALRKWAETLKAEHGDRPSAKVQRRLAQISEWLGDAKLFRINPGEAWSDRALADFRKMELPSQRRWSDLLEHAATADGARPKAKWSKEAGRLLEAVGGASFAEIVGPWFELSTKPRTQPTELTRRVWQDPNLMLDELNVGYLKGLAWLAGIAARAELAAPLCELSLSGLKKVPGTGPRAAKLSNAAIWALSQLPGTDGVAQLAVLKSRVAHKPTLKTIEKAYAATAEREGVSAEDIEEIAVPTYGLTDVGLRVEPLGDFTAELVVTGTTTTELRWIKPDGKRQKSVPKAVKEGFAEELASLKAAAKDLKKMLPAQRDRLDRMALSRKSWPYDVWAARYLNQPLMGTLVRRLIWVFTQGNRTAEAAWLDGQLVDVEGNPVEIDETEALVALWHPIRCNADRVVAWRRFFEDRQIAQPLKQAHREVYLLTDAERTTRVYSNRFASHILRQHQFNVLAKQRGWSYSLQGAWDGGESTPVRELPEWDLRAEFWVEGVGEEEISDVGILMHVATDQVRFYQGDLADPLPLEEVPPLVLSEVMRDVDLFVGVSSVGADPEWQDGGSDGRYRDYWQSYSFGDLSSSAASRKELLQRLVPRLKVADRCSFDDRFLRVRGDLRTYKIHLGSGNILMEPNDQYLCIVPGRGQASGPAGKVFLPFEGDSRLSVILSKAFLLAEDTKITDRTILSQIRR